MALLCFNSFSLHSPLSSPSPSSSILTIATTPVSRVHLNHPVVGLPTKCLRKVQISTAIVAKRRKSAVIVGAVGEGVDGTSSPEEGGGSKSAVPASENAAKEVISVDKLPLESKLKEREEQRLRMKLAKKIRLRRKRLVRKRKLRKKGRWPPSKMKKLKNV